jgi:DmsE family decaheme c-type cytochrome
LQAPRSDQGDELTDEVCMDCHDDVIDGLKRTAHDPLDGKLISCLGCHGGGDVAMHVDDPDAAKPFNPARASADSVTQRCVLCHATPHAVNLMERDPHGDANLSCTACHQVHNSAHASLLKHKENDLCLSCHASARASFAMPSHHPVMEGVVACRDCHIEIAQSPKQHTAGGPGETCVMCHGSMQGPFPYEHEAAVNYSVEDGGCMNCHQPHGSTFPRLLKQSYEAPHYSLCTQCHSVPKHLNNINHGTMWAGVPCGECHSDVHGSYTSPNLLDPSLETQGCFQAGCHEG